MEHSEVKSDLVALRGYIISGEETKTFRWSIGQFKHIYRTLYSIQKQNKSTKLVTALF